MSDDDVPDISLKLFIATDTPAVTPKLDVFRDAHGNLTTPGWRSHDPHPDIEPCSHPTYSLDDQWNTVHCAKCKERLDPYVILRSHAHYWERLVRARDEVDEGRKILRVEQLRAMI